MNRFIIIEDNLEDYKVLLKVLKDTYADAEIFPTNEEEHEILRKNFRKLFSGVNDVSEKAREYFEQISINNFTGILLDYQLFEDCKPINGVQFYKELGITIPALLLTKFTGFEFTNIQLEINRENLEKKIIPIQKGTIDNLPKGQKDDYVKNINRHILMLTESEESNHIPHKVLIVTTTTIEASEFIGRMKNEGFTPHPITNDNLTYWKFGNYHGNDITMIKLTDMGSSKSGGSTLSVMAAINFYNPDYIIMIGIAYGLKRSSQNIGDILVSKELEDYDSQKVTETVTIPRGNRIPAGPKLINRFDNAQFTFSGAKVEFGLILSGGKLSNQKNFTEQLLKNYPEAIGAEMEGTGLQSSCYSSQKEWILIKGICDWGYDKDVATKDVDQKMAISNACDYLFHTLKNLPL